MASVHFTVGCESTQWGQVVGVIGSWCRWAEHEATPLSTTASAFPTWTGTVILPGFIVSGAEIEYKYVILANGTVVRWEEGSNRSFLSPKAGASLSVDGGSFSGERLKKSRRSSNGLKDARTQVRSIPTASGYRLGDAPSLGIAATAIDLEDLMPLERALVKVTGEQRSWRQRLQFIRSVIAPSPDEDGASARSADIGPVAGDAGSLAVIAAYLSFLSTGQLRCEEDGGHHRPNRHAEAAKAIDAALKSATADDYAPFVARRIYPLLPSYAPQFTVSTPLTRIRDIAHRGDIPHDLKQEIKHTLQNKLHRCAGPEDLVTCANLLERVSHGGYSDAFVHELRRFHEELKQFFNAEGLDDRLRHLSGFDDCSRGAARLLRVKHQNAKPREQLAAVTELRQTLARRMQGEAPDDEQQATRLTDVELEGYAFPLLAALAGDAEQMDHGCCDLASHLVSTVAPVLAMAFDNIALSGVRPVEAGAIAAELRALPSMGASRTGALRARAAVARAQRFASAFALAVGELFGPRVLALAAGLGVEGRAAAVFAESEVRASVAFQASRVADAAASVSRTVLGLPAWDPLCAGRRTGVPVYVENLEDVVFDDGAKKTIVVARNAHGEEDIPPQVVAVILGRPMPHLSHLALRARQASVVFVCAEERGEFQKVWDAPRPTLGLISVTVADGLRQFEAFKPPVKKVAPSAKAIAPISDSLVGATKPSTGVALSAATDVEVELLPSDASDVGSTTEEKVEKKKAPPKVELKEVSREGKHVLTMKNTRLDRASAKATFIARLTSVARDSQGMFSVPSAVAVSHAAFHSALKEHMDEYKSLTSAYSDATGEAAGDAADAIRTFLETSLEVTDDIVLQLQAILRGTDKVMVRSSANAEDLEQMSGAGLYDSIANVPLCDASALKRAVLSVWGSLWTRRAAASRSAARVPHTAVSMAVLVQVMARASLSFVALSREPVALAAGDAGAPIAVEIAVGMGETLASAANHGSPYRFCVNRETAHVETVAFANFSDKLVPAGEGKEGLVGQTIDYSKERMTGDEEFRELVVARIAAVVTTLEEEFGGMQDVEGVINVDDGKMELLVVQARPQVVASSLEG